MNDLDLALTAATAGADIVRAQFGAHQITEQKGRLDPVTDVDRASEKAIVAILNRHRPEDGLLGEEGSSRASTGRRWIIDPLDGTTNFLRGIPHYAVSIACLFKGKLEHAVIVDPVRREEFTASRGRGAQLNGRRMRVSNRPGLDGALLGTGIPFKDHCDDQLGPYSKTIEILAGQCAGIRRAGAASLDLAYVAAGRLDAFWEIGLAPWDIAAGALLVKEAGGLVAHGVGHRFGHGGRGAGGHGRVGAGRTSRHQCDPQGNIRQNGPARNRLSERRRQAYFRIKHSWPPWAAKMHENDALEPG